MNRNIIINKNITFSNVECNVTPDLIMVIRLIRKIFVILLAETIVKKGKPRKPHARPKGLPLFK